MFNLYTPPCFAAMGAMNSEIKSKKWLFGGIGLQFATGFTIAFFVYQIGTLIKMCIRDRLYTPCMAAIAAVKRELGSGVLAGCVVVLQCVVAWAAAFLVYQGLCLLF